MKRQQLEHVIRAAAGVTGETEFVIIGSQAIHGAAPGAAIAAPELCLSMEADIYPLRRPELSDLIEGTLGRGSAFDDTFGYFADGVGPETAILPQGWQQRLVKVPAPN